MGSGEPVLNDSVNFELNFVGDDELDEEHDEEDGTIRSLLCERNVEPLLSFNVCSTLSLLVF